MNAFNLKHIFSSGDVVTLTIALILISMSIASWGIIINKIMMLKKIAPLQLETSSFWKQNSWDQAINQLSQSTYNPFFDIAQSAHEALNDYQDPEQSKQLKQNIAISDWLAQNLETQLDKTTTQLQQGISFLATTGSTTPFIGLFGTVWGIYHALTTIGETGSASLDQVAGPIGEALIMTALGLAVAIPAVLAYNSLSKKNQQIVSHCRRFADELHNFFARNKS